jgi:hypothetical protein
VIGRQLWLAANWASWSVFERVDGHGNQRIRRQCLARNQGVSPSSTTDYTYDPVDRLKQSVKTGNGAGTETYVHDNNANVISQTVEGTTTAYNYDRNRLLTATVGGTTANYYYDPFGRQESVTSGVQSISRSVYDGFDHVAESQKMDDTGAMKSTTYTFDPFDRTTSKTAGGKTTDFEYLGLSNEVLDEKVAGQLTKSYQYSPWGERLSQVKQNTDGTTEDGYYGYNSHTDVETLTARTATPRRRTAKRPMAPTTSPSSPASTSPTQPTRRRRSTTPTASTPSGGTPSPAPTTWASATTTRA